MKILQFGCKLINFSESFKIFSFSQMYKNKKPDHISYKKCLQIIY